MSPRVTQVEFRDQQRFSKYPFADTATLLSDDEFLLPEPMIIDASFYLVGATDEVRITQIKVESRQVTIYVGDDTEPELASGQFDPVQPASEILFTDAYGRAAGKMLLDTPTAAAINTWGEGLHTFSPEATPLVASVVVPLPEVAVRGFVLPDGELLTGHVPIVGKDGVVIRQEATGEIRIDIVGDPLFSRKACDDFGQLFSAPRLLKTINGIPADENGNFYLTTVDPAVDSALRVFPAGKDTIVLSIVGGQFS